MKNKPTLNDIEAFNREREEDLQQEPVILEEGTKASDLLINSGVDSALVKVINEQREEIATIKSDLAAVLQQIKMHKKLIVKQNEEIAFLRDRLSGTTNSEMGAVEENASDQNYNKELILKNIVSLIEDEGFSYNDVVRLFTLEGFLPPSPHTRWNDKVVEQLYNAGQ